MGKFRTFLTAGAALATGVAAAAQTHTSLTTATAATSQAAAAQATPAPRAPDLAPLAQMHYENRVRAFREQNLVYKNVILLGDSITEGFNVAKHFPGRRVLNRGIGSDVIGNNLQEKDKRGVLKRLNESVFDCGATDVFVLIGINDLGQGHSPAVILEGYDTLIRQIRNRRPDVKVYIQSVFPARGAFAKHNENILKINVGLEKLAAETGCSYVNLHEKLVDEDGQLKAEFTGDGLHLTEPAYEIWRQVVLEKLGW